MQVINPLSQHIQDYWHAIPANTSQQILYAFESAFVIRTLFTLDSKQGLECGALSALATAIYGWVTPLFKSIVGNRSLTWKEEIYRTFISAFAAAAVPAAFGNFSALIVLPIFALLRGLIIYKYPLFCVLDKTHMIVLSC